MAPRKSLENPKKLIRLQRTKQSKSTAKPTSKDVYNIALNSNGSRAIDKDNSFCLYIAYKAEKILNAASNKGSAKDAKLQVRSCIYLVVNAQLTIRQKDTFATKY
jgi:hypothetical protein